MYGTVDGFLARYPQTKITSAELSQVYLPDASVWLDSKLGSCFAVPFSSNNVTIMTLTYLKALHQIRLRTLDPDDAREAGQEIESWIADLAAGNAALLTSSGEPQFARRQDAPPEERVAGSTAHYPPVFTMDDPLFQGVSRDQIDDIRSERGFGFVGSGF